MGLNYIPISSSANVKTALKQIDENFRQIAAENQTKVIQQKGGTALKFGKLTNGSYGFVLYDTNNQPRVEIGFDASGEPFVSVNGTDGEGLINLGTSTSGTVISVGDQSSSARIEIGVSASGAPSILVKDTNGKVRVEISVDNSGLPVIALKDANGNTKIQIGGTSNGQQNIILKDNNNVSRILTGFHANGNPVIAVTKSGIDVVTAVE